MEWNGIELGNNNVRPLFTDAWRIKYDQTTMLLHNRIVRNSFVEWWQW